MATIRAGWRHPAGRRLHSSGPADIRGVGAPSVRRNRTPCPAVRRTLTAPAEVQRERNHHVATRVYELMVIVDQDVDDATGKGLIQRVKEMIEEGGGSVPTVDHWGRRRFAYPINRKHEGVYSVLEIVTDAPNLDDVDRFLRLADEVVRHKLIRLPDSEAVRRGLLSCAG